MPPAPSAAKLLAENGLAVTEVADYTGFPEMLDGRVKTLHPKVHGGILARRDFPEHIAALEKHGIPTIDMVVVNLYPFQQTVAKEECSLEDAIENIDIGGPTMLRSSAKRKIISLACWLVTTRFRMPSRMKYCSISCTP